MSGLHKQLQDAKECAEIIKFQQNGIPYPDFQGARVEPNQRLVEVFGIDNAFTNPDQKANSVFSKRTGQLMITATKLGGGNQEGDWADLRNRATFYFDNYLVEIKKDTISLAELTRFITLELPLSYLFNDAGKATRSTNRFEDIIYIGHRINQLWIDSKKVDIARPQWEVQTELHNALRRVISLEMSIPGAFLEIPDPNPLNLLLPAYETMWRVVMRGLLEIRYRNAADTSSWCKIMTDYLRKLESPISTHDNVFHNAAESGVRPVDIAKEALRLYPPTRRVHRSFHGQTWRADIETCQRSELLGGKDPLVFRPERWQDICAVERQCVFDNVKGAGKALKRSEEEFGYMPFAYWCAADHEETKEFGMKMIALLVAVLCEKLGNEWALENDDSLPEQGTPLDTDRKAYEDLKLRKS
ncbi:hypothetical protein EK21DRAFT_56265 [Setomelanomma holmii]|uniref:Uncharacterized protein n=1 Tax=Setomelanomma holmii TaxID=210430 RepID=A0A9P4LPA9_9PLEO|nr:hypothetical protein EK21DRAFT_56265 [Setomelanomma holmii]